MWLLAQADPVLTYINYGVLGLSVIMFILGKVVPGVAHEKTIAELKAAFDKEREIYRTEIEDARNAEREHKAEVQRLNVVIQDKVIPAMIRFTDVTASRMTGEGRG